MNFKEYFLVSEINAILESPVLTTKAAGKTNLVDPKTGKAWRYNSVIQRLKIIRKEQEEKGVDSKELWVSFSNVTRLGIYPAAADGGTPIGLYAYPIDYVIQKKGDVPYGEDRKYMLVFKAKRKNVISIEEKDKEEISDFKTIHSHLSSEGIRQKFDTFLTKRRFAVSRFINSLVDKLDNNMVKDVVRKYLDSVVGYVFEKLENRLIYSDNMKERAKIDDILSELTETNEFKKQMIEERMKDYILKMTVRYEGNQPGYTTRVKKYDKVDPQTFTATLSPEAIETYKKYSLYDGDEHTLFQILKNKENAYDRSEREFERISMLWMFLYSDYSKSKAGQKIINSINSLKEKIQKFIEEFQKKHDEIKDSVSFPFQEELKKYAEKKGLDWFNALVQAISSIGSANKSRTSGSFVYRFTEQLAQQMARKSNKKYYVIWMKILKELGLSGIADEFGTGTIHTGEPTQGVFFDPKQFELIQIITNNSHMSGSDYSGYPHGESKKAKQRVGRTIEWDAEDSPLARWFAGIEYRVRDLSDEVYIRDYSVLNFTEHFKIISKVLILVKTFLKFKDKIEKGIPQETLDAFRNKMKDVKTNLEYNVVRLKKKAYSGNGMSADQFYAAQGQNIPTTLTPEQEQSLKRVLDMYEKAIKYIDNLQEVPKEELSNLRKMKWQAFKNLQRPKPNPEE